MPAQDQIQIGSAQPPDFPSVPKTASDEDPVLLAKASQAIYKQNFELSIRNKTLLVLRRLSDITTQAKSVAEVTQLIADTIVKELNFTAAIISLVDKKANALRPVAITREPHILEGLKLIGKPLEEALIPLTDTNNLAVNALKDIEQKITGNMLDLLTPLADQKTCDQIARATGVKTIIIYPLALADRALGVLCLGFAKNVDDLSRTEKETLSELIGVVTIGIDRAQLLENVQKANDKLSAANDQLEVLDKLKDEFVSLASHELRTPMTAIKSYAWMLLHGKADNLDPKAREYLNRVYLSTERLIHLVNEMLDVSRIESGRVKLKKTLFDLYALIQDMKNEFQARLTEAEVQLECTKEGDIPEIEADREKIQQVLENIVGNALKYTPKGGTITVRLNRDKDRVICAISDNGQGIAPDDMPKLFKKFGRLENSLVSLSGNSTGLGLYITKQYVELHGGTIWAQSEVGRGSTFTFTLPIVK